METVESSHQCQALRFEGDRCTRRITHTATTGEWMELTEWNLKSVLESDSVTIDDVIRADGSAWVMGHPDSVLVPGDMIFINVVRRAWCDECVAEETRLTHWTQRPWFAELKAGDPIPNGTSRYCVNGYNDAACDAFCGPDDHTYRAPKPVVNVPVPGASVRDLAREFGCQENEVRAFYPDGITREMRDTDPLPADVEATIREAWPQVEGPSQLVINIRKAINFKF